MVATEARLMKFGDSDPKETEDIRGCTVFDHSGLDIGEVDDLLIDEQEHKVRFVQVASGGFLGLGASHFLVPIEAISHIDDTAVFIEPAHGRIVDAPDFDPQLVLEGSGYKGLYSQYGSNAYQQEG